MKKKLSLILSVALSLVLCLALFGCGGSSDGDKSADTDKSEPTVAKIEKNIDAVAEELSLTGGEETMYEFIGATAGKEYNDGEVELYQFDTASDAYKEIESSGTVSGIAVSAYKDGIALIFPNAENSDIKASFEKLEFK